MSCNGCRVLRKGCSQTCNLRTCLQWIESPQAQGNATLFLAKFFGRSDLMSLISAVPPMQRPALFQSLLFEACGRTVNPVNGAVGLLSSGNWQVCQAAVQTVLAGGMLEPVPGVGARELKAEDSSESMYGNVNSCMARKLYGEDERSDDLCLSLSPKIEGGRGRRHRKFSAHDRQGDTASCDSDEISEMTTFTRSWENIDYVKQQEGSNSRKILNLFV